MASRDDPSGNGDTPQQLRSWWTQFKRKTRKESTSATTTSGVPTSPGIFGIPLFESIKYANVAISLMNDEGQSFTYGYVPIVVAKCGVFLKEKATDVQGIFRLNGSAKRIKELQVVFDSPPRYGKGLDWTGYTVHDAANILRRYLNQMPQPIIPLEFYERFRDPLRGYQSQAVGDSEARHQDVGTFDHAKAIKTYQTLITEIPPLNRQLLLYILDLLAVFASKSDVNLMTSANLAAIFQPGLLCHPDHDMSPPEYRLSQDVLIFLVDNQDSFLLGMSGTEADEKTVKEVQEGASPPRQPSTPARNSLVGRSSSNASAGAESLRRFGGVRRNVSVSSKQSRQSSNAATPATPSSGAFGNGSGVHRSNTVPSKKSPAIGSSSRFNRAVDSPGATPSALTPTSLVVPGRSPSPVAKLAPEIEVRSMSIGSSVNPPKTENTEEGLAPPASNISGQSKERLIPGSDGDGGHAPDSFHLGPSSRMRKVSDIFSKSPTLGGQDGRQPNKLKKKRIPSSANPSAQSSTHSLGQQVDSLHLGAATGPQTPGSQHPRQEPLANLPPVFSATAATPVSDHPPPLVDGAYEDAGTVAPTEPQHEESNSTLMPKKSPTPSIHSATDHSDADHVGEAANEDKPEKKRRWRFSSSAKREDHSTPLKSPSRLGANAIAEHSQNSIASGSKPRKSVNEAKSPYAEGVATNSETINSPSGGPKDGHGDTGDKKGPVGWFKSKIAHAKEERRERDAERERAKSPPRKEDYSSSKASLNAIASRGRSMDERRLENSQETPNGDTSRKPRLDLEN